MILVPVLSGGVPLLVAPEARRSFLRRVLSGYLTAFAVFEITALPVLILTERGNFGLLCRIYAALMLILAVLGALAGRKKPGTVGAVSKKLPGTAAKLLWLVYAALLVFKLYMAVTHTFFDGDDAYYVAASVIADETGSMYRLLPYVGGATSMDVRHALAMLPMWIAFIARMSGTHATIVTHTMIPLAFHPLNDAVMALLGSELIRTVTQGAAVRDPKGDDRLLPAFMITAAVWQLFGNVSIYTPENFLIMRTWQGKSMFVNFLIPAVFYLYLNLGRSCARPEISGLTADNAAKERRFLFVLAVLASCTAGLLTSMAPVLVSGMMVFMGVCCAVTVRRKRIVPMTLLAILPSVLYLALWFYLKVTVNPLLIGVYIQ